MAGTSRAMVVEPEVVEGDVGEGGGVVPLAKLEGDAGAGGALELVGQDAWFFAVRRCSKIETPAAWRSRRNGR